MSHPFTVTHNDPHCRARVGVLKTPHGDIQTPTFMPVGTQATVKTTSASDMMRLGAQVLLSNVYHLYLRPGADLIQELGGLHKFMGWERPILTDSGGYQIFSLKEKKRLTQEGWEFKSHLDGSKHQLTPERVMEIQAKLGSDIWMPLDECVAYPVEHTRAREALDLTQAWLKRSKKSWQALEKGHWLFAIVQGGMFHDLRERSLKQALELDLPGLSIGGLSVGEPQALMLEVLEKLVPLMPAAKPRYLMGVGYPEDLVLAVERGVDLFDCVAPTRNGRNGTVFNAHGKLLLRNKEFEKDLRPIGEGLGEDPDFRHSRAYLRHLFIAKEMLGLRLASLWNLRYFINLVDEMRAAIQAGHFLEFKKEFFAKRKSEGQSHAVR